MDKIVIGGLRFYGHHGVTTEERELGGFYEVDLEIETDLSRAAQTDVLSDTIDYGEVCRTIQRLGGVTRYHLLEALAEGIADALLDRYPIQRLTVRLKKMAPPLEAHLKFVGIEILRARPG